MSDNEKIESTEEEPEVVAHLASDEEDDLAVAAGWCVTNDHA
jgi:hypothetical protein